MEDQGVWEVVGPTAGAVIDKKKDKKARSYLFQGLPEDLLMQVARKKTANEVWDYLKTRFVGADHVKNARLQTLKSDFNTMRMEEGETLDQYAEKLNTMFVRYANLGETLNNAAFVKKIVRRHAGSIPECDCGIEQYYNLDKIPFEEAMSSNSTSDGQLLLTQAEWQARQKKDGNNSSLSNKGKSHPAVDSSNRGRGGHGCGRGRGDTSHNDEESGSGGSRCYKSHIKCYNCYKTGHYMNKCKAPKKKEEEKGVTHITHIDDTELALLLAVSKESVSGLQQRQDVVLLNEEKLKPELHDTTEGGSNFEV
ncbi:uncharacterized protein LOC133890307 [Phragmites australis]|uniref:uncharacterized protein LOC133890307 n=1 Tax=Phragmites australis TaxID=29695 RepID=UPI002D78731A|nr:uncharacterized protein LOC133890307 [Phragmites australis]